MNEMTVEVEETRAKHFSNENVCMISVLRLYFGGTCSLCCCSIKRGQVTSPQVLFNESQFLCSFFFFGWFN